MSTWNLAGPKRSLCGIPHHPDPGTTSWGAPGWFGAVVVPLNNTLLSFTWSIAAGVVVLIPTFPIWAITVLASRQDRIRTNDFFITLCFIGENSIWGKAKWWRSTRQSLDLGMGKWQVPSGWWLAAIIKYDRCFKYSLKNLIASLRQTGKSWWGRLHLPVINPVHDFFMAGTTYLTDDLPSFPWPDISFWSSNFKKRSYNDRKWAPTLTCFYTQRPQLRRENGHEVSHRSSWNGYSL